MKKIEQTLLLFLILSFSANSNAQQIHDENLKELVKSSEELNTDALIVFQDNKLVSESTGVMEVQIR